MLSIIFIIIFVLFLWQSKWLHQGFNEEYLSKDTTDSVKGFWILIVFVCHIKGYYDYDILQAVDPLFCFLIRQIRQLLVVSFLFYSGYAVTLNIIQRGDKYHNSIPKRRILGTLLNFDVAVIIFAVVALCLKLPISGKQFVLSLTGWESVGNSNWYIFVILCLYLFSYIAHLIFRNAKYSVAFLLLMILLLHASLILAGKESWWYDTCWSYGAGAIYALSKDKIEGFAKRKYGLVLVSTFMAFVAFYIIPDRYGIMANLCGVSLSLLTVFLTMKVKVGNPAIVWLGRSLFPLYIYQRLPMIVLSEIYGGMVISSFPNLFFVSCLCVTLLISILYKFFKITL